MKTYAQAIDLVNDPKIIKKYDDYHQNVWPEDLEAMKTHGISRMKIWRVSNRLFMLMETSDDYDPSTYSEYTDNDPKSKEWDDIMRKMQQKIPGTENSADWWASMNLVFDSEWG
jgi:L-rhamnose mutarotase|tara:strand:- start:181 stop:522 length:342 start_codon:yes stop_codon:yes gene_type:complete